MSPPNDAARIAHPPQQLENLFGYEQACACGRVHRVDLQGAELASGCLERVCEWAAHLGAGLSLGLVSDDRTWQVAGERVERFLKRAGHRVRLCRLVDGAGGRPHADAESLAFVEREMAGQDLLVAVGSGTINDLCKLASFNLGRPYLAVATAPSMNGYTSAIAAIMRDGVKRTEECHRRMAVIADLDILAAAPAELIASGLGDLESKPTSTADFRLAGRLRDGYYCSAPEAVVLSAEARVADAAEAIGRAEPEAIGLLVEALLLSGISMKLAGSSSPASGGEHLLSHHWDMLAPLEGRVEGWHGAQVGVATIVSSALYESLQEVDPGSLDLDGLVAARPDEETLRRAIRKRHGPLADQVEAEFFAKHLPGEDLRRELDSIVKGWDELWAVLADVLRPADKVRGILRAAGAPIRMEDLGLSDEHLRRSFLAAREIRGRFTVLDFAADLGLLEQLAPRVLSRSGCLSREA